jgi:hypothetical protein
MKYVVLEEDTRMDTQKEKSVVATNDGKLVSLDNISVPAERVFSFVERNRQTYFEDHSLDWAVDEILTRGMAEITRQIKTARKVAENKASGDLLRQFKMSPEEAAKLLATLQAQAQTK